MKKTRNSSLWTEVGYELFAKEGMDGIQVESIARILRLNKSSFYDYFGDLETLLRDSVSNTERIIRMLPIRNRRKSEALWTTSILYHTRAPYFTK